MSSTIRERITLTDEGEWWVARNETVGVTSQGRTRQAALENLDDAVALHTGKIGEAVDDEDAFLREIGIDPEEIDGDRELPDFMV